MQGRTVLMAACEDGNSQVVQELLQHKPKLSVINQEVHMTLLHNVHCIHSYAGCVCIQLFQVLTCQYPIVQALLTSRRHEIVLQGNTALHIACKSGHQSVVNMLLAKRANSMTPDKQVHNGTFAMPCGGTGV